MFQEFYIPENRLYSCLINIYGIGHNQALNILIAHGLTQSTKVSDCNIYSLKSIVLFLKECKQLRKKPNSNKKRKTYKSLNIGPIQENLIAIHKKELLDVLKNRTHRAAQHKKSLPVRGQRTHSNANTQKN